MTHSFCPALRVVAFLMVCVTLFMCSPIRAEALALETTMLYAAAVIGAILLGIGVFQITGTQAWQNVLNDCINALKAGTDWITDEDTIQVLAEVTSDGVASKYAADAALVEWVRQWLVANSYIQSNETVIVEKGVSLKHYNSYVDDTASKAFWAGIDFYSSAVAADDGDVFLLSAASNSLPCIVYGLSKCSTTLGVSVLKLNYASSFSYAPYTNNDFPLGEFVKLNCFNMVTTSDYSNEDSGMKTIFMSYEDALLAYSDSSVSQDYYFYLTPESRFEPYTTEAASTGWDKVYVGRITNCGAITKSGVVSVADRLICMGEGYKAYRYVFVPSSVSTETTYGPGAGLGGAYIADPNKTLAEGYPQWVKDAIISGNVTYLPLGMTTDLDSVGNLSQEQIWAGNIHPSAPLISTQDYEYLVYYELNETPIPLFAKAYSMDGGTLTYQWYVDGYPIAGAVASTYLPPTNMEGVHEYMCLVGNFIAQSEIGTYAWTWPVRVTVSDTASESPGIQETLPLQGAADAEQIRGQVTQSQTEFGILTEGLAGAAIPSYGDIDLALPKIFGSGNAPGSGIVLASTVFKTVFENDSYIFWVFFIAFMLATVSFVVFGKRG